VRNVQSGKLAALLYEDQCPPVPQRAAMLPDATTLAIQLLHNSNKSFFLMIEGSQIDWAGHENNTKQIIKEMLDFDQTIAYALDFAKQDGNTLVIVTSDHETGGMSILNGKFGSDEMTARYTTKDHSGIPVPVFAYGPGADNFTGFMENTCFKEKLTKLLRLKK
jgi:alkaline phosphatase